MAFAPVSSTPTGLEGAASTASNESQARIAQDFDTFLTILTTQLQHQDPLSPMDSSEFTNQLVSFASVEQEIQGNQNLEEIASLLEGDRGLTAVGYLGRQATVQGNVGELATDDQGILYSYELPADARRTELDILDADGDVIRSASGQTAQGLHDLFFDGRAEDGSPLPAGLYSLQVRAYNNEDRLMSTAEYVTDTVTSVDTTGQSPVLTIGGQNVSLEQIRAVHTHPQS